MALTLVQVEDIEALLAQVPKLVDRLEARRSDFENGVHAWLKQAEAILESNRLAAVSNVAACRAMLVQAARGVRNPEIVFTGKPTPRKVRDATASLALQRANQLVHDIIAERRAVFQEADRLARQVIAVAQANGIVDQCKAASPNHPSFLLCVQKTIQADPNLVSVYTHLIALVGKVDVLIVLDRAIVD